MIVGAGPVGAVSALLLGRRGVSVTLIEGRHALSTLSQASTFHPSTLDLLATEGIDLAADPDAVRVTSIQWRDNNGEIRTEVDYRLLESSTGHPFRIHLDQQALLDRLALLLAAEPRIVVRTGLTALGVDPSGPSAVVSTDDGRPFTVDADSVVGCDGSHSTVRTSAGFGFTASEYPTGAIRAHLTRDLAELMPPTREGRPLSGLCYFRGGGDGVSVLQMADTSRLIVRTTHPSGDLERLRNAVERATPWHVGDLGIDRIDSYRLTRGVADGYLCDRGPVMILGDAAHVTSTAGGLNMNCGLHEAFALMPVLADFLLGRTGWNSVADVAEIRRTYVVQEVIPRSEWRVKGLQDPSRTALREHLDDIDLLARDAEAARRFLVRAALLDSPLTPVRAE
ncbi:MAG: FAD-dependent monooxygenase [Mycobacterium sp.]|nr:FAD-dependent monooxygenase [Mycobacterium sp.]